MADQEQKPLPDPPTLAALVSRVTGTLCGVRFRATNLDCRSEDWMWLAARLHITGPRPLAVYLSSNEQSCRRLSALLFACPPDAVQKLMMEDALRELLNMAAGEIKRAMGLDQVLEVPEIVDARAIDAQPAFAGSRGVALLQSDDPFELVLWVQEAAT